MQGKLRAGLLLCLSAAALAACRPPADEPPAPQEPAVAEPHVQAAELDEASEPEATPPPPRRSPARRAAPELPPEEPEAAAPEPVEPEAPEVVPVQGETLGEYRARADALFARLDSDGDGRLTRDEIRSGPASPALRAALEREDTDMDERLTRQQYADFTTRSFQRLDADGDGVLTEAERAAGDPLAD